MPVNKVDTIWMNGSLVKWDDAKIHVLSHVVHYGTSWFEGIRCYDTARGSAIFRLGPHMRRLLDSLKIYRTACAYSQEQLESAAIKTIKANKLKACYIRPVVYRGYGEVGVNPTGSPVDVAIAVWEWGAYLGSAALADGIDVCISTWHRPAPNTLPTMAKAGGNYLLSQMMKLEAIQGGYSEAIALDVHGNLSEGSGENLFLVRDGVIHTPPYSSALLPGITRLSILQLAEDLGYKVKEMVIPREMVYVADEIFFSGTAAEITPIRSVDKQIVGNGKPGPVTQRLQAAFFNVVKDANDPHSWLTFI
jgi:branched-chain amino acid aminotransferase